MVTKKFDLLDTSIIHGDGTTTVAKKGGDVIGYNGHKHMKGNRGCIRESPKSAIQLFFV